MTLFERLDNPLAVLALYVLGGCLCVWETVESIWEGPL